MKNYLLTYAVFFQSIIVPYSSLKKYRSNHALFFGELYEKDKSINSIPTSMCTDYIKGARPVREELVHKMCKEFTPEKLTAHIDLLGIQDISAVFETLKKLLHIVELSESLRKELLEKLENAENKELFLVEIFRLSLQIPNTKCGLSKNDMLFLNNLASTEIAETPAYEPKEESATIPLEEVIPDKEKSFHNKLVDSIYDEIDQLLTDSTNTSYFGHPFSGQTILLQEVNLPADFDALIRYVGPFMDSSSLIYMDFADVGCVCNLDVEKKCCRNGSIFIFETTFNPKNSNTLKEVLYHLPPCNDYLLMVTAGLEIDLSTFQNIADTVQDHLYQEDGTIVYSLKTSEVYDSTHAKLQLVCHVAESVKEYDKTQNPSSIPDLPAPDIIEKLIQDLVSNSDSTSKHSKEEKSYDIKIPDIFKIK